jgi:hypothetical protein
LNLNDTSTGAVTLGNLSGTSIAVLSGSPALTVAANAVVTATNGALTIEDSNTTSGTIKLGAGSNLSTGGLIGGNVEVTIGVATPGSRTTNANVTVTGAGGTANFGNNGITATGSNTVNLVGDSVILSSGTRPATAFALGGNVTVTADPTGYVPVIYSTQPIASVMTNGYAITQPAQTAPVAAQSPSATSTSGSAANAGTADKLTVNATSIPASSISGAMAGLTVNSPVPSSTLASASNAALQSAGSGAGASASSGNATPLTLNNAQSGLTSLLSGVTNANLPAVLSNLKSMESPWISETELSSGKMPAIISSDIDLGISNEVSTVVELEEKSPRVESNQVALAGDKALVGNVSQTVKGTRTMHLKKGTVVFAPTVNTVVSTEFGQVRIAAHSVVMMMSFRDGVAIYDLDDNHRNAVSARVYNQEIPLGPGKHLLITRDDVKSFEHINPAQMMGYNNVTDYKVGGGLKVFSANFSIPSAMQNVLPLSQLIASEHPQAKRVGSHMLKTAALLGQMHNVPYEQVMRQSVTAYQR